MIPPGREAFKIALKAPYLAAFWGPRRESAEECALRLERSLIGLGSQSELLQRWYPLGRSKAEAQRRPVPVRRDALAQLLLKGRSRGYLDNATIDDMGFISGTV